jgi:4-hydroxybenzoate polyprenyltransferase
VARRRLGRLTRVESSALRPAEWLKNGFVLAPLLFSGAFDDSQAVSRSAMTFIAFCAIASAGYLVNDVRDRALDREHPRKRHRAIASGRVEPRAALRAAAALAVLALVLAAAVGWAVVGMVVGYAVIAGAYSLWLKAIVIIDVLTLAALFLVRVTAGSLAISVEPSEWLLCCTAMLALLLGFSKRRQELAIASVDPGAIRPVLEQYSTSFVDQMVSITSTGTVVSYTIYAIDSPLIGGRMLFSAGPVLYGIMRFLYLIYQRRDDRPIAVIASSDPGIIGAVLSWCAIVTVLVAVR